MTGVEGGIVEGADGGGADRGGEEDDSAVDLADEVNCCVDMNYNKNGGSRFVKGPPPSQHATLRYIAG